MKQIAWFKTIRRRRCGKDEKLIYFAVREDAKIQMVNVTEQKVAINTSMIGNPQSDLEVCSEREFSEALQTVVYS